MSQLVNLTGQKFGRLTVLYKDQNNKKTGTYWVCQCDCGNIKSVRRDHLINGHIKSCGCYNIEAIKKRNFIDLTGQTFGKLTVIKQDKERSGKNGKNSKNYWFCKCSCGNPNLISVSTEDLRSGHKQSCGCLNSKGELKITLLLTEMGIEFITQKTFDDLRSDKNNLLRFDFFLPKYNTCIEYQGIQHYRFDGFYNKTQEDFLLRQKYDNMKEEYCQKNNINLIIINYKDYYNLNKEILKERIINESKS